MTEKIQKNALKLFEGINIIKDYLVVNFDNCLLMKHTRLKAFMKKFKGFKAVDGFDCDINPMNALNFYTQTERTCAAHQYTLSSNNKHIQESEVAFD